MTKVARRWSDNDAGLLAASVTYYGALSLFPLMMILTSAVGFFLKWTDYGQDARQQILRAMGEQLSPMLAENMRHALEQVQEHAGYGGPIGALTLLFAAIAIFAQFERAFDRIWNVRSPESATHFQSVLRLVRFRLRAFVMLISLAAMIVAVFFAELVFAAFRNHAPQLLWDASWFWSGMELALSISLNALVFGLVYRLLPKVYVSWQHALAGGLLAAVVWEIGRQILAAVVVRIDYTGAYGVLGSLLAVMLWGYYAVSVVFLGAVFVQVIRGESPIATPDKKVARAAVTEGALGSVIRIRWQGLGDVALLAIVIYLGAFLGLRYFETYDNEALPPEHPQRNVVVFSKNATVHGLAYHFFQPLIRIVPGRISIPQRTKSSSFRSNFGKIRPCEPQGS